MKTKKNQFKQYQFNEDEMGLLKRYFSCALAEQFKGIYENINEISSCKELKKINRRLEKIERSLNES